jgi:tRNA-2-methylthio-N6-dimethylallyladenosine synthase
MNVYDSARMADVLAPLGYRPVDAPEAADLIILNTCHIREKAAEKVYSDLGRLQPLKASGSARAPLIAVAGCVAQAEGAEILRRAPYVDMVFGPQTYHRLPEMVARVTRGAGAVLDTEFPAEPKFDALPGPAALSDTDRPVSAFLTIQEGCDKFCTFCVVPYTRGPEYSRTVSAVEAEAQALVACGIKEITLLGQNVNAYHGRDENGAPVGLGALVRRLARIEGLARLRYTTSHPRDVDDALIACHGEEEKLMPFLHLPVQSGSDRILTAMNRGHDSNAYRRVIDRLRAVRPDIALSSDFIVGFPGETDADFAATLDLVREIGFAGSFSFKFSARPGTPAATLEQPVPETVKDERLQILQSLLREQQERFNRGMIGRILPVLFERRGRRDGQIGGRSPYLQPVHLLGPEAWIGTVRDVRIVAATSTSLEGAAIPDLTPAPDFVPERISA